jgi:hypothetical protein
MTTFMKALLISAAIFAAPGAHAATYVTYTIGATVTGGFTSAVKSFGATFTVPVASFQGGGTYYDAFNASRIGPGNTSIGTSATGLTFEQRGRVFSDSRVFFKACTPTAFSTLPTTAGTIAVDPSCSTASLLIEGLPGYDYTSVTGIVTSLAVSLSESADSGLGLTSFATFVPEPATWALMLTGFAMAGYALRRRRATVAIA